MYSFIIIIVILLISALMKNNNKILPYNQILHKNQYCKEIKFNASTIPENLKCFVTKNIIIIMKNINKDLYVSGNEVLTTFLFRSP